MKAVIRIDVPDWQLGQEVTVHFPDTMCKHAVCEEDTTKEGYWIYQNDDTQEAYGEEMCSECGSIHEFTKPYCSQCGCRMIGRRPLVGYNESGYCADCVFCDVYTADDRQNLPTRYKCSKTGKSLQEFSTRCNEFKNCNEAIK